ncbi:MAG: hypothetical protein A2901_00675 [Elusimicrobia bacterium RIFCSPLOWO2_01_FULL_54_10]|nr:MAG: hypothetical protein A2901_00675 [Elusimicrobia bacterium RIFCSPLOWO2_01_FULL_54_10]
MRFSQILSRTPSPARPTPPNLPRAALTPRRLKPAEVYGLAVRQARAVVASLRSKPARLPDLDAVCQAVDSVILGLKEFPSGILAYTERSTADDYLPGHLANVCILALAAASKMDLPAENQRALGVGALLHDAAGPSLDPKERLALLGNFLNSMEPSSRAVVENILLQREEQEAKLVQLCHDYETQSHPGPSHSRRLSHDVLRALIERAGENYDGNLLKKLWDTLSLFPPGSFVRLSSGEIARVLEISEAHPIKPRVQAVAGPAGERVREEKILDLSQPGAASIEAAVDECAVKLQDPSLQLELKAQKWWMDS